ncbi:MAG: NAD-dependent epimerase/dehydratase family protein [Ignavibacteria bacterium]|nr:NAD-dependent epimerase/dehydratase family protein [Ignavibacteria bacterium]
MNKKITITGGAGFIGSHIAEAWNSLGAEVTIIDNLRTGFKKNLDHIQNITLIEASVTDANSVRPIYENSDVIYHFASMVSVPESFEFPSECFNINVGGLCHIIEACQGRNDVKIIYSSSAATFGNNPNCPLQIDSTTLPLSPYGSAKLAGEHLLQNYLAESKINAVTFRHFNVFGPRQNPRGTYASVIPIFIYKALQNEDITIHGTGEQVRDFVFVKDVASANILAAQNYDAQGIFHVGHGVGTSIINLARMIINLTGSKSKIIHAAKRRGDIDTSIGDISRSTNVLGFLPRFSIEEGLAETIDYYKNL